MTTTQICDVQDDGWILCESSNLAAFRYNVAEKLLDVRFAKGPEYRYFNVPPAVFHGLRHAESKGKYLNAEVIKAGYTYERLAA